MVYCSTTVRSLTFCAFISEIPDLQCAQTMFWADSIASYNMSLVCKLQLISSTHRKLIESAQLCTQTFKYVSSQNNWIFFQQCCPHFWNFSPKIFEFCPNSRNTSHKIFSFVVDMFSWYTDIFIPLQMFQLIFNVL